MHWPHAEKCEPSHVACQPHDAAYPREGPLWQLSVLDSSVSSSVAGHCGASVLSQQPPLRLLGRTIHAVGTHLVVMAQCLEHDHHISHLNLIKNIFQNSSLYLKNPKNHKIKKIKNSYQSRPMLHSVVTLDQDLLGNLAQHRGSHLR